jgi:hypothetical protein
MRHGTPISRVGFAAAVWASLSVAISLMGCIATESCLCPPDRRAEEKSGAELWAENCTRCHNLRPPDTLSDAEWDTAVMHMRVRANLTGEESRKIVEFLKSAN